MKKKMQMMLPLVLVLVLALLVGLGGGVLMPHQTDAKSVTAISAGHQGVVTASALNMRSGPGNGNKVIGVLKKGSEVTVKAVKGNWYQVQTSTGKTGYVYSGYLSAKSTSAVTASQPKSDSKKFSGELLVSAAASLTDAMNDVAKAYNAEQPGVKLTFNFGSSGSLQQQIEQGAPADIFISAATKQMNALDDKGLIIKDTKKNLLKNRMVLVVPKDSTSIKNFSDLTKAKVIALGEPESVPAGKYGQELLTKLGLWDKVSSKAVYAKDVRQVLAYVESGDADAGIVYRTDALISDKVKVAAIADESLHSPVVYPAAVIKATKNEAVARDFVKFLNSGKADAVFEKYGFTVIK
ncbi:MAG: molybdate ABC transporter substrate-binding protein [Deltaproteobacteria bacterium]